MSEISDAWERYVAAAAGVGANLATAVQTAERTDVLAAFTAAGLQPIAEVVDYFATVFSISPDTRVYRHHHALDLNAAIAKRAELVTFAMEQAAGGDAHPDDFYPEAFFPITTGKPTVSLSSADAKVYSWWWDPPPLQLEAPTLVAWLDQRTAEIVAEPDEFRLYFNPELDRNPSFVASYQMRPGQVWAHERGGIKILMNRALDESRQLVVTHRAANSLEYYEGLERLQAEVIVQLMVNLGADPARISIEERLPRRADRKGNDVEVWGEYVDNA